MGVSMRQVPNGFKEREISRLEGEFGLRLPHLPALQKELIAFAPSAGQLVTLCVKGEREIALEAMFTCQSLNHSLAFPNGRFW